MIYETNINLKNKTKTELIDLLEDALKIIDNQNKIIEQLNNTIDEEM